MKPRIAHLALACIAFIGIACGVTSAPGVDTGVDATQTEGMRVGALSPQGGTVTTSSSTTGTMPVYTASNQIGNGPITVSGGVMSSSDSLNLGTSSGTDSLDIKANNTQLTLEDTGSPTFKLGIHSNSGDIWDIDPTPANATDNETVRFFRHTNTTGFKELCISTGNSSTCGITLDSNSASIFKNGLSVSTSGSFTATTAYADTDAVTASTADRLGFSVSSTATFDATAADRNAYGLKSTLNTGRSAGSHNVINYGVWSSSSSGQTNYAFYDAAGDNYFANGTTTLGTVTGTISFSTAPTFTAGLTVTGGLFSITGGGRVTTADGIDGTNFNFGSVPGYGDYARVGPAHLNWLASTDSLPTAGASCAGTSGTWTTCNNTSTLTTSTHTGGTGGLSPRGQADTVASLSCANGSSNCSVGGSSYQQILQNATTGVADVRSTQFTLYVWAQSASGTPQIQISGTRYGGSDAFLAATTCTLNASTWTLCSVTGTTSSASLTDNSEIIVNIASLSTTTVYVTATQLNTGALVLPYQSNDNIASTSPSGLWANGLIVGSFENDPWWTQSGTTGLITNKGTFSNDQIFALSVTPANGVTIKLNNNNGSTIAVGTVVYSSVTGKFDLAKADAASTAVVVGLVADVAGVATSQPGRITVDGPLTLTTGQWDAIAGTSGGLAFGSYYYLSDSTAGHLTSTKPSTSTHYVEPVCLALSTTQCVVRPTVPVVIP